MQLHVRLAADDTGRRTRRVDENAIERAAIPPAVRIGSITHAHVGGQAEPLQVFAQTRQPPRVAVERGQFDIGRFQDMRALAAGRGAGIEHALAVMQVEQAHGLLRGAVLHRKQALAVTGQTGHVAARLEDQRVGRIIRHAANDALLCQLRSEIRARDTASVDAQPQRRRCVVRGKDGFGLIRPIGVEFFDQPTSMRRARHRIAIQLRASRFALAQPAPQHGVDEARKRRLAQGARGLDRGSHGGVVAQVHDFQLHEAEHEQGADVGVALAQRPFQQAADSGVEAQPPACAFVQQARQQCAVARIRQFRGRCGKCRTQRLSRDDAGQRLRRQRARVGATCAHARFNSGRAFR